MTWGAVLAVARAQRSLSAARPAWQARAGPGPVCKRARGARLRATAITRIEHPTNVEHNAPHSPADQRPPNSGPAALTRHVVDATAGRPSLPTVHEPHAVSVPFWKVPAVQAVNETAASCVDTVPPDSCPPCSTSSGWRGAEPLGRRQRSRRCGWAASWTTSVQAWPPTTTYAPNKQVRCSPRGRVRPIVGTPGHCWPRSSCRSR